MTISYKQSKNQLNIYVEDSVPGINSEMLQRIFESFVTTEHLVGHKGLGLNVAANLVHFLLRGQLNYHHGQLGGAGFLIQFPLHE